MALEEIELHGGPDVRIPEHVLAFLKEADRRIDRFFEAELNKRVPKFMPSDPLVVYRALEFLTREDLPLGRTFCEWGSGFGVVTCLAGLLGYESYGIEIEQTLAEAAEILAGDMGIAARFLCTSYMPEGIESYSGMGGEEMVSDHRAGWDSEPAYDGMGCDISGIDVFFVYPWPGEQEFMENQFEQVAVEGAILVVYYGEGEIRAYRKVFDGEDADPSAR